MRSERGDRVRARVGEELAVRTRKKKRGELRGSIRVEKGREALRKEERRRWVGDGHDDRSLIGRWLLAVGFGYDGLYG